MKSFSNEASRIVVDSTVLIFLSSKPHLLPTMLEASSLGTKSHVPCDRSASISSLIALRQTLCLNALKNEVNESRTTKPMINDLGCNFLDLALVTKG